MHSRKCMLNKKQIKMNHLLWDMLTRIRNGQKSKKISILQPKTKLCCRILDILLNEGFILGYNCVDGNSKMIKIHLKYFNNKPVIKQIKSISKPSKRVYVSSKELWKINNLLGILILSTSKGMMSDKKSKKLNVGGEVFFFIK